PTSFATWRRAVGFSSSQNREPGSRSRPSPVGWSSYAMIPDHVDGSETTFMSDLPQFRCSLTGYWLPCSPGQVQPVVECRLIRHVRPVLVASQLDTPAVHGFPYRPVRITREHEQRTTDRERFRRYLNLPIGGTVRVPHAVIVQ